VDGPAPTQVYTYITAYTGVHLHHVRGPPGHGQPDGRVTKSCGGEGGSGATSSGTVTACKPSFRTARRIRGRAATPAGRMSCRRTIAPGRRRAITVRATASAAAPGAESPLSTLHRTTVSPSARATLAA